MQITLPLKVSALSPEVGEENALDNVLNDDTADPYAVDVSASDARMPSCFYLDFDVLVPALDSCSQPPWPFSAVPGGILDSWSPRAPGVSLRSLVVFSCRSACPSTF